MNTLSFCQSHEAPYSFLAWATTVSHSAETVWDTLMQNEDFENSLWMISRIGVIGDTAARNLLIQFVLKAEMPLGVLAADLLPYGGKALVESICGLDWENDRTAASLALSEYLSKLAALKASNAAANHRGDGEGGVRRFREYEGRRNVYKAATYIASPASPQSVAYLICPTVKFLTQAAISFAHPDKTNEERGEVDIISGLSSAEINAEATVSQSMMDILLKVPNPFKENK